MASQILLPGNQLFDFSRTTATAPQLLTERQAAQVAGVSCKTIRRLIEQGRLKAADFGTAGQRNYRIRFDDLANVQPALADDAEIAPSARPVRRRRKTTQSNEASSVWP